MLKMNSTTETQLAEGNQSIEKRGGRQRNPSTEIKMPATKTMFTMLMTIGTNTMRTQLTTTETLTMTVALIGGTLIHTNTTNGRETTMMTTTTFFTMSNMREEEASHLKMVCTPAAASRNQSMAAANTPSRDTPSGNPTMFIVKLRTTMLIT